jgi:NAD(P)-dependent dehydrogenase (short-subunit alcohol dehydrogenase family)
MKTIFITGTSSGLGKAAVHLFHSKGWNVIATMRNTTKEKHFEGLERTYRTFLAIRMPFLEKKSMEGMPDFGNINFCLTFAPPFVTTCC